MKRLLGALLTLAALFCVQDVRAQGLAGTGSVSISASASSARVQLPAVPTTTNYKNAIIAPAPGTTVEVFYALGGSSVTATTASYALPSGGICVGLGSATYVAAVTASSTATVRITQVSTCTNFAGGSGGGGGGGTGDVNLAGVNGSPNGATNPIYVTNATAALGQKTAANSTSVVMSTDNNTVTAVGPVASGSAVSGNPVRIGCVQNTAPPTVGNATVVDVQCDTRGSFRTILAVPGGAGTMFGSALTADGQSASNNFLGTASALLGLNAAGSYDRYRIDPCQGATKSYAPISITSATTTVVVTGTAAQKIYVCNIFMSSAIANNVAFIEGTTGTSCATATAGVVGGTTTTNGVNFAANGGVSLGSGGYAMMATATNQNDFCLVTSSAGPLSGNIAYVKK